jgi:trimeric autotransporter adhesin
MELARLVGAVCVVSGAAAVGCSFEPPPDVRSSFRVSGSVEGMWDGAAVVLRLDTGEDDDIVSVAENGAFDFELLVTEGSSYSVTVDEQPTGHDCRVSGGAGTATADISNVVVTCDGPSVDIELSAPLAWAFDPATTAYSVETSFATQATTVSVLAEDATEILLEGTALTSGTASDPVPLALGTNTLEVEVHVGDVSRSYAIEIDRGGALLEQFAYGKASNTDPGDEFGAAIAIDGDTLVVGAPGEDSSSTGVNRDESNDNYADSGAVYVFRRRGTAWIQEAYLKASNTEPNDRFGASVAVSGDLVAVGAAGEDSPSTGVNGSESVNSASAAGAVYVFRRVGESWVQDAYVKASNTEASDQFGEAIALSGDTLVVGAIAEDSDATSINGNQASNAASLSGAVYVFRRGVTTWAQEAYVKASNTDANDRFGWSVDLDGNTMVVGAFGEGSAAKGIGGDQTSDSLPYAGAAYVFVRTGTTWTQQAYIKASNTESLDGFGDRIAISGDILAVTAAVESSNASGIDGDQTNNDAIAAGAVYVFRREGSAWAQEAYVKASNPEESDYFGRDLDVSGDVLVVGARQEGSSATGVDGDEASNAATSAGAAYVFRREGTSWSQAAYVKASNTDASDYFGAAIAASRDTIIVGAKGEDSSASGFDGDQPNDAAADAGAIYVFR